MTGPMDEDPVERAARKTGRLLGMIAVAVLIVWLVMSYL